MADLGVFIKIGASSKKLVSEVGKAGKSLKDFDGKGKNLNKSLKVMSKSFIGLGVAAAGVGVAIVALTVSAANNAKEMQILAESAGVGVEEFQRLAFAAKSVGIEQDQLSDILKDTNDRLGDFITSGAGEMKDFFEIIAPKVGVTVEMFKKLNSREALGLYVDSLEKANLSQAQMTFFMEGIASESTKLLPLLKNNGKAMRDLGREADDLGAVLSNTEIEELATAAEEIGKLKAAFSGLAVEISKSVAPILTKMAEALADVAKAGNLKRKIKENEESLALMAIKADKLTKATERLIEKSKRYGDVAEKNKQIKEWEDLGTSAEMMKHLNRSMETYSAGLNENTILISESKNASDELAKQIKELEEATEHLRNGTEAVVEGKKGDVVLTLAQVAANKEKLALDKMLKQAGIEQAQLEKALFKDKMNTWQEEAEAQAFRIQDLNAFLMTEQETKQAAYEQDLADLKAAQGTELESIRGFNEDKIRLDEAYAESKTQIDQLTYRDSLSGAAGMFGDLSTLMDSENRAGFEIGKAAAIANAGVKGALAAINSFEAGSALPGGPVTGAAFAAASLVATGKMISDLSSISYGGGGGGGSAPNVAAPQVQQQQSTSIDVSLTGNNFNKAGVEDLFEQINSGLDDGMVISGINLV